MHCLLLGSPSSPQLQYALYSGPYCVVSSCVWSSDVGPQMICASCQLRHTKKDVHASQQACPHARRPPSMLLWGLGVWGLPSIHWLAAVDPLGWSWIDPRLRSFVTHFGKISCVTVQHMHGPHAQCACILPPVFANGCTVLMSIMAQLPDCGVRSVSLCSLLAAKNGITLPSRRLCDALNTEDALAHCLCSTIFLSAHHQTELCSPCAGLTPSADGAPCFPCCACGDVLLCYFGRLMSVVQGGSRPYVRAQLPCKA